MIGKRRVTAVAVLAIALGGCGSSTPTGPKPPNYSGSWRGTTSGGLPITFSVSGDQVSGMTAQVRISYLVVTFSGGIVTFSSDTCDVTFTAPAPVKMSGTAFETTITSSIASTVLKGSFVSETSASGTIDKFSFSRICDGRATFAGPEDQAALTWKATKG